MVGQKKLFEKINNLSLKSLPHSLMLVGEYGCGKHLASDEISSKLGIPIKDISDSLNAETINNIYDMVTPQIYTINGDSITLKEESAILKFIEEPSKNAYIIIFCENRGRMLNTILNRCIIWEFEPYTMDELLSFAPSASTELLKVANTPGKLIEWSPQPISDIQEVCDNIINRMINANIPNALTLPDKIAWKEEDKNKYNKNLFLQMLLFTAKEKVIDDKDKIWYNVYVLTNKFLNDSHIPHIDFQKLFENYILNLKTLLQQSV